MRSKFLSVTMLLVLLFASFGVAAPAGNARAAAPLPNVDARVITPEAVESLVDNYIENHMQAAHAPGLVIAVVHQGRVVLSKGYGYADLETHRLMTPGTNLRAGSASKPVTSAAVLQMVSQGLVRLDAPVSDYLSDLPLEDRFGRASTVAQLLTLKGGYSDKLVGTHAPTVAQWQPLGDYLASNLEPRANPPGVVYSYTSWEHALLGYMLERVSGVPFDQVMAKELFQPLGMQSTTFTQPLPEPIAGNLAQGYAYRDGEYEPVPMDLVNLSPGIAMVTTAQDMSRFMLALLDDGKLDGVRVLSEETVNGLLTRQEEIYPYSRARTYGFSEIDFDQRPALYHDGNGIGFGSRMVLVPEQDFGLFVSVNHRPLGTDINPTPAYRFLRALSTRLVEEFIPVTYSQPPATQPLPDAASRAPRYVGHYALAGTPQNDFFKVGVLIDAVDVSDNRDGTLTIGSGRYVEVEPLVFRRLGEASSFVIFRGDEAGRIEYLTFGGTGSYKKAPWFEGLNFTIGLVGVMLLVFLSFALTWPFARQGHWVAWVLSLLNLVFLVGLGGMLFRSDLILFFKTIPPGTHLLLSLPWFSAALALSLPVFLVGTWRDGAALWGKLHYTLTSLAAFAFVWFAFNWNLFLK